ncbi:terpene cyclase/mutase family protein [soil metagenome]
MTHRRQFLGSAGGALLGMAGAGRLAFAAGQQEPDGSQSKDMITPAAQVAINQGLRYLAGNQSGDGSYGSGSQTYNGNVAVTSLAALAMMAGGHQPGRNTYGDNVTRALRYVLDQADPRGFLISRTGQSHGPMYGHGFGVLFLSEVYGMVSEKVLRDRLQETLKRSIRLIVDSQNKEGGWRYLPSSTDADVSVTICQIMGLRAARNAGFYVPKSTVDRCTKYVERCQDRDGGFRYQVIGGPSQFARSAAGVVALYCAGIYKGDRVENGLKYLMDFRPGHARRIEDQQHFYYGHYYAAQAMWTAGGKYWSEWFPAIRDALLTHERQANGCWVDHRFSNDYATAMACIILQIPNNYLPILQK